MLIRVLLACVAIVFGMAERGASVPQAPASSSKPLRADVAQTAHATFSTSSSVTSVRTGTRVLLYVDVTPKPTMHIYAPGEKDNLPITLTIPRDGAYTVGEPTLPPPQKYVFPPLKLTQLVYNQPFRITQPLTIVKPLSSDLKIAGSIRYQACDDLVCYFPKTVEVSWLLSSASR